MYIYIYTYLAGWPGGREVPKSQSWRKSCVGTAALTSTGWSRNSSLTYPLSHGLAGTPSRVRIVARSASLA